MKSTALFLAFFVVSAFPVLGQGIVGKKAPKLEVDSWVSLPKGQKAGPTLAKLKGKVVYLYYFQSW